MSKSCVAREFSIKLLWTVTAAMTSCILVRCFIIPESHHRDTNWSHLLYRVIDLIPQSRIYWNRDLGEPINWLRTSWKWVCRVHFIVRHCHSWCSRSIAVLLGLFYICDTLQHIKNYLCPDEITTRYLCPDEITTRYLCPDEITTRYLYPDEITTRYLCPDEITARYLCPDEITTRYLCPDEITTRYLYPDEITASYLCPDEITDV